MFYLQVFTDDRIFMLLNAQVDMTAGVAYNYNSNQTNYIEIHTQRIIGLQMRALVVIHDRLSFRGRLVACARSQRISDQGYSYRAVDWLNTGLVLVLGGVKSLKSRINKFCRIFQLQKHFSNYIGYTSRHLHLRIEEHRYSVIGKQQFTTLKKCRGKFECLIYEMLLIRKKRPTLNTQNDSIPAKLFI